MTNDPKGFEETETVQRPRPQFDAGGPAVGFKLEVSRGPDQGSHWTLDGSRPSRVLMGQSPACELRLTDPSVSRRHLALDLSGNHLRVTDLDSTNGTRINGVLMREALLEGGEHVQLGDSELRVERTISKASKVPAASRFGRLIGQSHAMRRLYPLCERIAASTVPTIIEGETGTGKEVLAESLHEQGPRASAPFLVFDCTAVAPQLVESELFGHEKGAFTGALTVRKGLFEESHGGTLFIDEIGDLDLTLQPKLLRAIERGEIRRVGSNRALHVDVRILSATRRDLDKEVQAGRFRDDLFHRLAVARIELPPLRNRQGDIAMLARQFLKELGAPDDALPPSLLARWEQDPWNGNVRQLRNAVARQVSLGDLSSGPEPLEPVAENRSGVSFVDDLLNQELPFPTARDRVLQEFERRYVARALSKHGGKVAQAAAASGLARRYFQVLKSRSK